MGRVDVVGLSLCPWLAYATPATVPTDYLAPLFDRIGDTPVVITETGWPAKDPGGLSPPWSIGDSLQTAYVARLAALIQGRDVPLVDWLYLYPPTDDGSTAWKMFGTVSVRDNEGARRPVYDAWAAFGK
jgi:hypothetical protein